MLDILSTITSIGSKILDKIFPDPQAAAEAKLKLLELQQSGELARLVHDSDLAKAQAEIIKAEAQSESWLTRNWRPIAMLTFLFLAVARFFGWESPNVTQAENLAMWKLLEIGIGGYIVSRGAEKIAKSVDIKGIIKNAKK